MKCFVNNQLQQYSTEQKTKNLFQPKSWIAVLLYCHDLSGFQNLNCLDSAACSTNDKAVFQMLCIVCHVHFGNQLVDLSFRDHTNRPTRWLGSPARHQCCCDFHRKQRRRIRQPDSSVGAAGDTRYARPARLRHAAGRLPHGVATAVQPCQSRAVTAAALGAGAGGGGGPCASLAEKAALEAQLAEVLRFIEQLGYSAPSAAYPKRSSQ